MCSPHLTIPRNGPEPQKGLASPDLPLHPAAALPRGENPDLKVPLRKGRLKLWDLPDKYHCPIIGTCLHVEDLRRLARKAKTGLHPKSSDYEVHVRFVGVADDKHPLSVAAQKLMDKKHARTIRQFATASDKGQLLALWQQAVAAGQVPGAFWALMTHPRSDIELRAQAYRDVHMLSHQVGAGLITDTRVLAETRAELIKVRADARQEAQRMRAALAQRERRIHALDRCLTRAKESEKELAEARTRITELQSGRLLAGLRERLARMEAAAADLRQSEARANSRAELWRARLDTSQETLERAAAKIEELQATNRVLEQLLTTESDAQCEGCDSDSCTGCPDLAGRRILCIGGRSSLICHYRSVVDRYNGELVHHDGGMEDSHQRLDSLLNAADVVVCPADCVSHNAYLKAKRYCKRTAKPCVLLKSSGVASFARALGQLEA